MKTRVSVQERLKDLRVERGLKLEELAEQTAFQNPPWAAMRTTTTRKSITAAC